MGVKWTCDGCEVDVCCVSCSLLMLQWKSDTEKAVQIIESALEVDPLCEYAYEILGTVRVQQSVFHFFVGVSVIVFHFFVGVSVIRHGNFPQIR